MLIGRLTKFSPFQAFISRSLFFTTCKIFCKIGQGQNNGRRHTSVLFNPHSPLRQIFYHSMLDPDMTCGENNERRHTSVQFGRCRQFDGFYFEPHQLNVGCRQKGGSCKGDSANPLNSWMARISKNIKDLKGGYVNFSSQMVINCFQSIFQCWCLPC